ncbi:MAG: YfjI family protein [Pantoea sp.]|uniref:YfjI family protein n=1 Tax=Pantoea sp. TaxID=69393 RepID=UPI0028FE99CC|nr:YfjI family protein [Pantoea sp.]MDU1575943.1 YfjI family protein [Pantoea sp.]
MFNGSPFPVDAFPQIIRNAIYEVEQHTQAPQALIAASALGVISLACQNRIDVCRLNNLRGPVSLFLLTLAESGERKSTVDKLLMEPLYQLEENLFEKYTHDLTVWRNDEAIFNIEKKSLMSKLKSEIRCNKDHLATNEKLKVLLASHPKSPVRFKQIFNDATPAAIKDYLCGYWRSVGIMSDEAGTIFNGYTLNELPFINKMWDGAMFPVERKSEPEKLIRDARMTLSLMVQPNIFKGYIKRKGDMAKGIGFFARCLICQPGSTQGNRQITSPVVSTEYLPIFHQRLMKIVNESIARNNENDRLCLRFTVEAEKRWIAFSNNVEYEMGILGRLSNFKDYASKMAENMARIAALLHHFNGDEGDISLLTVEAAVEISTWYVGEYVRLFSKPQEFTLAISEADELYWWINNYCIRLKASWITKNTVLQYGPNKFRNRSKANEVLNTLYSQNRILTEKKGKTVFIAIAGSIF